MELESNLANAYRQAYQLACDSFVKMDFTAVSLNAGVAYDATESAIAIRYLNRDYRVDCTTGAVSYADCGQDGGISPTVKALILHYLIHATPRPLTGRHVSFKEIPGGGAIYASTFHKRAVQPLMKAFAANRGALSAAAQKLGGEREKLGHESATIRVLPLVPVTCVVWEGDEEMPPSATILFDESVAAYLPVEDIVLAASYGVYALMALAR